MRILWKFIILSFTIPSSSPLFSIEFCFEGPSACFSSHPCSSNLLLRLPHSLCHFHHRISFKPLSPIHRHLSPRSCCSLSWGKSQLLSSFLRFSWVFFLLCFQPLELDWSTMLALAQVRFHQHFSCWPISSNILLGQQKRSCHCWKDHFSFILASYFIYFPQIILRGPKTLELKSYQHQGQVPLKVKVQFPYRRCFLIH